MILAGGAAVIADYDSQEDRLVVELPAPADGSEPLLEVIGDGADAVILLDGAVMARVTGAAGLGVDEIGLRLV